MAYRLINPALEEYQRPWNGRQVDLNLPDAWLERLNSLHSFVLVSICEGHHDCNDCFPEILLSARAAAIPRIKSVLVPLRSILDGWTGSECRYRLTCSVGIANIPEEQSYLEMVKLSLRRTVPRLSAGMDPETTAWFESMLRLATTLDQLLAHDPYSTGKERRHPDGTA